MTGQRPTSTHTLTRTAITALLAAALQLTISLLTATPAAADPTLNSWTQLRNCESGGNYTIVAVNGHYGAYQFDLTTWRSVGGTGKPNQATPAEQDYRALYLYRMRGWQPWTCARNLHLPGDRDAKSRRKPTHTQSAYMSGPHTTPTPPKPTTTTAPAWPGKVYNYGDCDPPLSTWQRRMNTYGYTFEGTGCYYTKTKTAVLAVQRANHIKDSGLLGPKTWLAAWHGTPPKH
ncbi:MAG TPA: transglycosylase family protein [Pseudonocardiaceae bacterium]|nr:transglycosylase family protein [Pseudonocardiaceae bacterium]